MRNTIKSVIVIIASVIGFGANAQTKSESNSLLWEVSGNGLAKSSYLYGTMHMMCEKDFMIPEKAKKAFGKSDKLALEIDLDDPAELQYMQKMSLANEPLSKVLSKEEYQKLDGFLKETVGVGASQFENSNMLSIMSVVMMKALSCPPKMFEMEFLQMAIQRKMETIGLEKIQDEVTAFDKSYSNEEFIEQLKYYDSKLFQDMSKVYNSEKLDELYAMVIDKKFMDDNTRHWMLDFRNENWMKSIPELMKKESVFFAVGAGHLAGEKGLIMLLRKAGYTLKPVMK
ncbi:hypothetical protein FEDK69T_11440 [Flavobacterium enshiense DK69]|uniref:Polysaccharide biosynthesis protein GumN n=1 Tax=Flavobacterium enshiense DK69 TaxID=1107311 RepID=V6SBB5_9FLAO|nr:TraB/GumN family protein [Flavobacterium enshiense]ESU23739.1 hypothetical protein FEDK69T_11440 [Flavobacterium enshiense DK69]KGO96133.1 hypothetical protein Q767_07690 [Flavobacterium enshiense DK69]